jgi:hypothetical protein
MTENPRLIEDADEAELERLRNATVPALDHYMALVEIKRLRKILRTTSIMAFAVAVICLAAVMIAVWWRP